MLTVSLISLSVSYAPPLPICAHVSNMCEEASGSASGGSDTLERKKRSAIWSFFVVDKEDKSKAVCLTCEEKISRGGKQPKSFNTTNLRKHLEHTKGHEDKYKEYIEQEKKRQELLSGKGYKQVTLEALAEKRKPYAADHPRAKAITERIAEMMAVDLQPFSMVDDIGFCRFMGEVEPRYALPSRRHFSESVIPSIHAKVKYQVCELLRSTSYVSVTTDIWSSSYSHHSFMSLTAHFIVCASMEKKNVMLSAWKFDESHTADNIAASILSHVQSWEIEPKLVCVLRDNAANMIAGMRVANIPSLPCLAHTLQLIIKDGVLLQPVVQQLLSCARTIVGHYHRSNVAFQTFKNIQQQLGLPDHCLIQDVTTRWNSSYYMLERLIEQKRAITVANTECQPPTELRASQWLLAEKVVLLLKIFEEATREASGDYASASVVIPMHSQHIEASNCNRGR